MCMLRVWSRGLKKVLKINASCVNLMWKSAKLITTLLWYGSTTDFSLLSTDLSPPDFFCCFRMIFLLSNLSLIKTVSWSSIKYDVQIKLTFLWLYFLACCLTILSFFSGANRKIGPFHSYGFPSFLLAYFWTCCQYMWTLLRAASRQRVWYFTWWTALVLY